jgi:uncharacterized protein YbjQ (UPF0145 family)
MKTRFYLAMLILVAALSAPNSSTARNTKVMWPIADAMAAPDAKSRLSSGVRFFFGSSVHPAVATSFGVYTSNKKTNGTNKTDKEACEWAFLSAMLSFQQRAVELGGNAVINIRSYYDKHEVSSETEYECGSGALMSGVTFRGEVVKLEQLP